VANRFIADLEAQFAAAGSYRPNKADWLEGAWAGLETASDDDRRGDTAAPLELLRELGIASSRFRWLHLNRKIAPTTGSEARRDRIR